MRSADPDNVCARQVFINQFLPKAEAIQDFDLPWQVFITVADDRKRGCRTNDVMTCLGKCCDDVVASRKARAQGSFRNPVIDIDDSQSLRIDSDSRSDDIRGT